MIRSCLAVPRRAGLAPALCLLLCSPGSGGGPADLVRCAQPSEGRAQPASPDSTVHLKKGDRVEREIAAGVTHTYAVTLGAGQFAAIVIDQRAVDLVVAVVDPGSAVIAEFDGRWHGPEPVFVRAAAAGVYRIDVRTTLEPTVPEPYVAAFETAREAAPDDERRLRAARLGTENKKLIAQATAASLQSAAVNYQEALSLWRELGDRQAEAATLNSFGFTAFSLGRFEEALGRYRPSLQLWRELGYERGEAEALLNIGAAHSSLGEKREALAQYEQALVISRRLRDRRGEMYVINNIASVMGDLGEPRTSLESFGRVLELANEIGDQTAVARALVNTSTAYQALGAFQQSLEYAERAMKAAPPADLRGRAVIATRLGDLYLRLGDPDRSRAAYEQGIELARAGGDPRLRAFTTLQLSILHRERGELDEAFERLSQAQALAEEVQDRRTAGMALAQQAELLYRRRDIDRALESFRQATVHLRAVGDARSEAIARLGVGLLQAEQGDRATARKSLGDALTLLRAANDRYNEAQVLLSLARIERDENALDAASAHAAAAIEIIDAIRSDVISQQLRTSYTASTYEFYKVGIDILMRRHARDPSAGFDRAALELSERSRARGLLEMLSEARADIREGVDPLLLARERLIRERVNAKAARLMATSGVKQSERAVKALEKELEEAVTALRDVEGEIRARSPRFAAVTLPRPLGATEIQAVVDADTVLLMYALGEPRSYVWAIRPTRIDSLSLPSGKVIEEAARRVHAILTARAISPAGETLAKRSRRIAEADAGYASAASTLSDMILGPVFPLPDAARLIVAGEGALQYLPIGALPIPRSDGRPLLVAHETASIPSASSLMELRRDAAARQAPPRTLAVLADPVFSSDDPRIRTASASAASASPAPTSGDLQRAAGDVSGAGGDVRLARLPFTRREADAILRYVRASLRMKAVDFDANYAAATSAALAQYRFVHFATHGLLNAVHPELSGLVLSLVGPNGRPQHGFLRTHEVYNLRLPADLVVLSGCRTGLGSDVRGEGIVGLARGFMYAGAQRVAVSLWQVDDEATAELMSRFYAAMLRDGLRPTAALRAAQLDLRKTPRWRAPFYWAGFVLQGEWR